MNRAERRAARRRQQVLRVLVAQLGLVDQRLGVQTALWESLAGSLELTDARLADQQPLLRQALDQLHDLDARLQAIEDLIDRLYVQPATRPPRGRQGRHPRHTGRWQRYRSVDCPTCGVLWETAEARYDGARWDIRCPTCGVQVWRAVLHEE
ncbi:MAG TPA: hypothetical protein VFS21_03095 [Roseiflexaceae bacterium]|nr:hypothetical protein [Roseiflexaceae bacterium]